MCGFFGAIGGKPLKRYSMTDLWHRGPDSWGEYRNQSLYLKHFRLAIVGKERYAAQPICSQDGRVVLVFNGEIYNYRELADWIKKPHLAQEGDARVLVEFLAHTGFKRIDLLNGMFAIVLYNKQTRTLYLLRDRFGVKPLYYTMQNNTFYFASEIKCFKRIVPLSLNQSRIIDYLEMGVYPSGKDVFYNGIYQVEPGTYLTFKRGKLTLSCYFDLKKECAKLVDTKLNIDTYEQLLSQAIRLRLRSDVPISLHYSGGTDSTTLLLKTKEVWNCDYPLTTYTMAYREREFDEWRTALAYCQRLGVKNTRVFLTYKEVPHLAEELHYFEDEPYGGIPTIAYYKLNRLERQHGYIVSLEGQGGDETFGGYLYHTYLAMYDLYRLGEYTTLLNKMLSVHRTTRKKVIEVAEKLLASGFTSHTDLTDLRQNKKRPLTLFFDWLKTIQLYDILQNKLPRTLRFNDRASMAWGREVRFPFLDHNVLVYGLAFSHALKYGQGLSKYPLRMIIRGQVKKSMYRAPKRSVVTPQTLWLMHQLKGWALERIALLRKSELLPDKYFKRVDTFYARKSNDNSFYLWQLINLSFFVGNH